MFILGKKVKMTQLWKDDTLVPVTVVFALPNTVSVLRTKDKDGYTAVQVQEGKKKREFRVSEKELESLSRGNTIDVSAFQEGDIVEVRSVTKGRGFQGVVKRHGFSGGPKTHGQKNRLRAPGSIGSTAPQRVVPGRRMAGRMGGDRVTVRGLVVARVEPDKHLLMVRGAIPGARGTLVGVRTMRASSRE